MMGWLIVAALISYFIKGISGFANTLIFTSILSFKTDNVNISPMELLVGYPTNLIIAWKERKQVDLKVCMPIIALILLGNIPGIFLLKHMDTRNLKIFFGFVIIALALEMWYRATHSKKIKESKIVLFIIGIITGLLCGLFGIGALLAAYMSRVTDDTSAFKGNMCVVFTVENTFRIIAYIIMGIITFPIFMDALKLVPVMIIGLFAGMKCGEFLDEGIVKKIVIVLLIVSGISLIVTNL